MPAPKVTRPVPPERPPDAPPPQPALTRRDFIPPMALASREVAGPGPWFDPLKCPELRGPSSEDSAQFSLPPRPCGPIPSPLSPEQRDAQTAELAARAERARGIHGTALAAVREALASETGAPA